MPYLTHLDLGDNQIQFIEADEFIDAHQLRSLKLDGNMLPVVLDKTFLKQSRLRTLCLARNRLAKITKAAFLNLTSLVELDISYNKLVLLEEISLQPIAATLEKLVISGNAFSLPVLADIFHVAIKVRELEIADMELKEIPDGLPANLLKLNVSGNSLQNISTQYLPKTLKSLDLSRNKFKGLDENVIQKFSELTEVHLINNSWNCDLCHITSILFRVNKSEAFYNLKCASPQTLKGRLLTSLNLEDISTCNKEADAESGDLASKIKNKLGLIIGAGCLFLFLVFCITFVVYSCMRRHANRAQIEEKEKRYIRKEGLENATVIFDNKDEITFKFPLDLTERKLSVSTIDEMKKETHLNSLPNGTATVI